MTQNELKLVFNALKQCDIYAFAGGLGLLRATAHRDALAILEKALAQPAQDVAALVEGMEVSIDVSTSEHDSTHRLFGVVDLVQENQGSKHDLILLVQEPKANFKAALAQPEQEQEPVAWRTFDGEGGYDYCSYEDNENYADDWNKRNPNHIGWVEPLYTHPLQRIELQIKLTDPFESARVGDYNRGWNDCLFASGIVKNT